MAIDAERLVAHRFPELRQHYSRRDTILYALGVGLGADPMDSHDLDYLLETRDAVLPAFAGTLASPGMWIRDPAFGVDFAHLVHAEQRTQFHAPLPSEATVVATPHIAGLYDRGAGRGAVVLVERTVADAMTGTAYATILQTLLLRGDGGFGGPPAPRADTSVPDRAPDQLELIPTSLRSALIYRLSGDWNPLHADPAFARKAGFERPILHGLATYGMIAASLERLLGRKIAVMGCRFSGVVVPGDELTMRVWMNDNEAHFEVFVADRSVIDRGVVALSDAG